MIDRADRPKGLGWWSVCCDHCGQHVRWERYPIESARCVGCAPVEGS